MSEHEDMLRYWTMTLIAVLFGFTIASMGMEQAGEGKKSVEVLVEGVRDAIRGYTLEEKLSLTLHLVMLSGLALRVESPSRTWPT